MIINCMKFILALSVCFLFYSCSTDDSNQKEVTGSSVKAVDSKIVKDEVYITKNKKVVQVELMDKKALMAKGYDKESVDQAIINSGFVTKKKWYRANEDHKDFSKMSEKSVSELKSLLVNGDAVQTTLIIEVLSHKGPTAVSVLVDLLNDKRTAVFKEEDRIYWYEEKNQPPQEIEIRIFAAMHLEKMVGTSPYGVTFDFHMIQTNKGPVEVLYAVKGSYAVNKDDVCKNWLKWWSVYGGDYK
ncbi:MAG: hypothetical protein NE328_22590 [Lentisphaeraceae bacterium]|nr:hypothetical protein [Lentisphaeraceae bacterium]